MPEIRKFQLIMDKIYRSPEHPAAFGGQNVLYNAVKPNKSLSDVKQFLLKNKTYRKFRKPSNFERARIFVTSMGHMMQADLFDMQNLSRYNKGFRYFLLIADCFSRKIWARPLKNKTATAVSEAMRSIFVSMRKNGLLAPRALLASDLGTEFWNSESSEVLKDFQITQFPLRSPKKASMVELSGRWLKNRIYKYMHANNTNDWTSQFDKFIEAKNGRKSPTLNGLSPDEINYDNQAVLFTSLYPKRTKKENPLNIGQKVQISVERMPFSKSYHGYFSEKIYEIIQRHDHRGIFRYTIRDTTDDAEIAGTYYAAELLPIE